MTAKSFAISKQLVWDAYKRVRSKGGAAGIDEQSITEFEKDLKNNLYKLWNKMSSGSYFPPAVKRVEIPKKDGSMRPLGIPTVTDRIAQMVVKLVFEPAVCQSALKIDPPSASKTDPPDSFFLSLIV